MANIILDLLVDRVDLVDEGANSAAFIKLYKRKETEQDMTFEEILAKMKPEHAEVIKEAIAKAKSEVPEATAEELKKAKEQLGTVEEELKKAKTPQEPTEPDFEEVIKSLDPSVQKVFKAMKEQKEAAEEIAKQAAEKQITEEAVAKAKELKALPVEEDKLVDVLKGISPEVLEILKAANKAIEEGGLLDEVGKSKAEKSEGSSAAWSKIEKMADKLVEEKQITKAKAIAEVTKSNPELYREYLKGGAN